MLSVRKNPFLEVTPHWLTRASAVNTALSAGKKKLGPRAAAQSLKSSAPASSSVPTFSMLKAREAAFAFTNHVQNAGQKSNP